MSNRFVCAIGLLLVCAATAQAQVIGTFRWQTQPYCNVVTLTAIQQGPTILLSGWDNQCGAGTAPVTGTAVQAGGSVVFGFAAGLPSGRPAHISATISLASLSGSWVDSNGSTGNFVYNGSAGGSPRPSSASSAPITASQLSPTIYSGSGVATTVARGDHLHDDRYYTESESNALLAAKAGTVHTHDDRYYTETESNAMLATKADRAEVLVWSTTAALSYVPEVMIYGAFYFTTTKAGRVDVQAPMSVTGVNCSAGAPFAYLVVDNTPIRSSVMPLNIGASLVTLRGVSTDTFSAGIHYLNLAIECSTTGVAGYISINYAGGASMVVIP